MINHGLASFPQQTFSRQSRRKDEDGGKNRTAKHRVSFCATVCDWFTQEEPNRGHLATSSLKLAAWAGRTEVCGRL